MKTKFSGILTLFLALIVQISFAQEKTISGVVSDETGPLPGVSILKKGTTQGTETDFDGKYSIKAKTGDVLVFSFVGMKTVEKTVGASNSINIAMQSANVLEEVVVTALGVEKKKDEDLSSASTVAMDDLKRSGESGVIQGLSGKTAGVSITRSSGDPGAGAYIKIRGQNTIYGGFQPLIIVDGIPVSNSNRGGNTAGVTQQSRLNDINPEDIKSITIQKGAAAAAIYGTGASNGVIVITTKQGSTSNKLSLDFKSSVNIDRVGIEFEKQNLFGQGENGVYSPNASRSWGDRISERDGGEDQVTVGNQRFVADNGTIYYPIVKKNSRTTYNDTNRNQVLGDGITFTNSLGVRWAKEGTRIYTGLSNTDQKGIIKGGSNYNRKTLKFNVSSDFTEKLTAKFNFTYSNINSNRIQQGSNLGGLYLGYLRTPVDFDNSDYKGTSYDSNNNESLNVQRGYLGGYLGGAPFFNNPGWTINEQTNPSVVNRFIFNPELSYEITDNIKVTSRFGYDTYTDKRETFFPTNSAPSDFNDDSTGEFERRYINEITQTFNTFFSGNSNLFGDKVDFSWLAGMQLDEEVFDRFSARSVKFSNPFVGEKRIFGNAEAENETPGSYKEKFRKMGYYSSLSFNIDEQVLLELTGRYEKASTLNNFVFYPSVSAGWIFSKNLNSNNIFSFGKIRASWGQTGVGPQPYSNKTVFETGGVASGYGDQLLAAVYGNPFRRDNVRGNPDLKEERKTEYEIGTDLRFLNDRLSFGATYYFNRSKDVILDVDLPASSGFASEFINGAQIKNSGIELELSGKVVNTEDLSINLRANFAQNKNIVESLSGTTAFWLAGFTSAGSYLIEGQPYGVTYGRAWDRDDKGNLVYDTNGFPMMANSKKVIGDPNPEWTGGLGLTVNYKNLFLSSSLETSQGGTIWNGTRGALNSYGISPETANVTTAPQDLKQANGGTIAKGTVFRGDVYDYGKGLVARDYQWYRRGRGNGFSGPAEQFIEDASWTKLREITLGYNLKSSVLENIGIDNLQLSISGRNLYVKTNTTGVDPETNLTGVSQGRGLVYFNNPNTKSYIGTLKVSF